MDKVVLWMAIALAAIAIFLTLEVSHLGLTQAVLGHVPENDGGNAASVMSVRSVADCSHRTYIPTPGGKFHSCPAIVTSSAAITDINGFPACVRMYDDGGSRNEEPHPTTYDFVMRPNSTGYITVIYDFGVNDIPPPDYFTALMKASNLHRLSSDGSSWIFVPANQTSLSVYAAPENVTKINPTSLKVTYTIETKDTRHEEIGKTYLFNVYQVCTGELITIGEKPYTGRLPLD